MYLIHIIKNTYFVVFRLSGRRLWKVGGSQLGVCDICWKCLSLEPPEFTCICYFPLKANLALFPIRDEFCKSFVKNNLNLVPHAGFHQHRSIDSAEFTPNQTPGWRGPSAFSNYSENDRDCKHVPSSALASVWAEWARLAQWQDFDRDQRPALLLQMLTQWPHTCVSSLGRADPRVLPRLQEVASGSLLRPGAWWRNGTEQLWPSWAPWLFRHKSEAAATCFE